MFTKARNLVVALAGVFLLTLAVLMGNWKGQRPAQLAEAATARVEHKLTQCIQTATAALAPGFVATDSGFDENGLGVYLFNNQRLLDWNNSQWPLELEPSDLKQAHGFLKLRHGYYLYATARRDSLRAIVLSQVKPVYELQNNYLSNAFSAWLNVPEGIGIDSGNNPQWPVTYKGKTLFGLKAAEEVYYAPARDLWCLAVFLTGLALGLLWLLLYVKQNATPLRVLVALGLPLLVRALLLVIKQPAFLYRTALYDPRLFGNAQSYINGFLGDVLLNAILGLFVAAVLYFYYARGPKQTNRSYLALLPALLFAFFEYEQFNRVLVSLVNNSVFNYNFLSLFSVKPMVLVGLSATGCLALALYLALITVVTLLRAQKSGFWLFAGLAVLVSGAAWLSGGGRPPLESLWLLPVALPLYWLAGNGSKTLSLAFYTLCLAVVTSFFLNVYMTKNQALDLGVLAQKLEERQDDILESEFVGIPAKIVQDDALNNLIDLLPATEKEVELKLKQNYLNGYFDRYDIRFSLFDKNCLPLLSNKNGVLQNEGFFEDKIRYFSEQKQEELYFVSGNLANTQYLARIPIKDYRLYVLFEARHFEEVGSFPDLFLDQSLQRQEKLRAFTYAVYRNGQLNNRFGPLNYPFFTPDSLTLAGAFPQHAHHFYEPEAGTRIVISEPLKSRGYFFTFNSYIVLFYSLLAYLFFLLYMVLFTQRFQNASFTRRIQAIIVLLLLLAMLAVSITSGRLVKAQFNTENLQELEEKTSTIIHELSQQFTPEQVFDASQKELLNDRLREYSRLFNTPISLFDKNGQLFNTSEPKLYDFGLAAGLMHPGALKQLQGNVSSVVPVNEKAGTLNYLSLYTPLFDEARNITGFINLPYFARQGDLANELSQIISALINVYVILFVFSIVAGLILSGYITRPLRLIKQQLAKITLGSQNEKITWQSNDEIGQLVAEYNLMLNKLEESANLLARSERESAWREMAKQVAHEIKNPLTPMKLNLQYLQHLIKSNPEDFKERFEKASAGIIEQIDALATIATEFSNFAKLPQGNLGQINLADVITTAVQMFEGDKRVRVVNHIAQSNLTVRGDREQCLRVFNNLLNNAVQACEDTTEGLIELACEQRSGSVVVSVRDNGTGIDAALKPKIFSPNFTTKSTGSGLGLAMVKNIVEGFGGSIRFESEKGQGTTFYVEFVAAE